jgi:KamA family protein
MKDQYITDITRIPFFQTLKEGEQELLKQVVTRFPFKATKHYLSLIDWNNPYDPLKRIIFPDPRELDLSGCYDPSREEQYTVQHGLQHKYKETALLLLSDECSGICRFCFRKRLFMDCPRQTVKDYSLTLEYVRDHPEITDVLLTGGDPLILSTSRLAAVIHEIREIDHINVIRIGTKTLAYNPYRISEDETLINLIKSACTPHKKVYIMAHFNHPAELSKETLKAIYMLQQAGAIIVNQTPIIDGVNADPKVLTNLFNSLSAIGVSPYYVFQCRPTIGNHIFTVPVEQSYQILQSAYKDCSGLAKRARFIMSHSTGKIEVIGQNSHNIFMRYHQAADPDNYHKVFIAQTNPEARWFDDYKPFTPGTNPIREWLFEGDPASSPGAVII